MEGYHITKIENLYGKDGIIRRGLIPQCGERSRTINDSRIGISFTNDFYTLPVWRFYLYPRELIPQLCVLSFQIDDSICFNHINKTEFITHNLITPDDIFLTYFFDKKTGKEIPFTHLDRDAVRWLDWINNEKIEIEMQKQPIKMLQYK